MTKSRNTILAAGSMLAVLILVVGGCKESGYSPSGAASARLASSPGPSIAAGSTFNVAISGSISSENAHRGDHWSGTVTENVPGRYGARIPAGSVVNGEVVGVKEAVRGSRAELELGVRSVVVDGHEEMIVASSENVVAGSPRARNLGAIAGGAAAGAIVGNNVGDGRNATVGGLIGGAAAAAVVANSRGYQVVLRDGVVLTFTVRHDVGVR